MPAQPGWLVGREPTGGAGREAQPGGCSGPCGRGGNGPRRDGAGDDGGPAGLRREAGVRGLRPSQDWSTGLAEIGAATLAQPDIPACLVLTPAQPWLLRLGLL
jgi:hypothetical protein